MPHPLTMIDPEFSSSEDDERDYRELHKQMFGHEPTHGMDKCRHPIHAEIRRRMNGATFTMDYDPNEIISDDANIAKVANADYQRMYDATKQFQKQVEEEEKWERMRKLGLVMP